MLSRIFIVRRIAHTVTVCIGSTLSPMPSVSALVADGFVLSVRIEQNYADMKGEPDVCAPGVLNARRSHMFRTDEIAPKIILTSIHI